MRVRLNFVCAVCFSLLMLVVPTVSAQNDPISTDGPSTGKSGEELSEAERNELIAERDRLAEEATRQYTKGNFEAGTAALLELFEIERRVYGTLDEVGMEWANRLAGVYEQNDTFEAALALREEVLESSVRIHGESHWQVTDARLAMEQLAILQQLTAQERAELAEAQLQHQQIVQLFGAGRYDDARSLAEQGLQTHKEVLGEQHRHYATSLNNLAMVYQAQGDVARAEPLYREALEINKDVLGERHPEYATNLNNLADVYQVQGDYAGAESLLREASEILKEVHGERHADYAVSLNNLGMMYVAQADYERAEPLLREVLEILKAALGERHPNYATSLNNLADVCQAQGDYARAESLLREASEILREVRGDRHPEYAVSLNNLGMMYQVQGDYAEAEPLLREVAEILKEALGDRHPYYATILDNLGILYRVLGDYARAEPLLLDASEIRREVLGERHADYGESLNSLAALYHAQEDYKLAEPLYREASEIRREVLGERHPKYAASLNNLALLYGAREDYARAKPLYIEASEILREVLGERHPAYATNRNNLALLYQAQGNYTGAEPLHREASEILKEALGDRHPDYAGCLNNLAGLYHAQGDYTQAEPLYREASQLARGLLVSSSVALSERQQLAMADELRHRLDSYLSLAQVMPNLDERAFEESLAWKGATLVRQRAMRLVAEEEDVAELFTDLQSVTMNLATLSRSIPNEPQQLDRWREQIAGLTEQKERLEADLSRQSATYREAQEEVTLDSLLEALPEATVLVDFLEYKRWLPPEPGDDWTFRRSLVAFVVQPGERPVQMFDLGRVAPLQDAVNEWRTTYGMAQGEVAGQQLRAAIWEPLLEAIGEAETVLVSVDGFLGRLPMAALPGKEPGTYLVEDHRLAILPVPQLLPVLVSELGSRALTRELLLMGDVNYDAEPEGDEAPDEEPSRRLRPWERRGSTEGVRGEDELFGPLAATAGEIATIGELYTLLYQPKDDAIVRLRGAEATEEQFRAAAPQCYQLHIATHGFFADPEKESALQIDEGDVSRSGMLRDQEEFVRGFSPGLLSGLAFAGANQPPQADRDDGILTADEIAFLPLGGVDLVTLSACETGLGEVAGGEGLLGIQRAFQVSGARTTIASLWKVDDYATRVLMERFYRNLWEQEMSKLDALREAQIWVLQNPDVLRGASRVGDSAEEPDTASPRFWAAFQLSGDWR